MACCALFMQFALGPFILDETQLMDDRVKCFELFGTFSNSMLSMFEVTLGPWIPICRFLYSKVDSRYALLFIGYRLFMGIAVLRVMYGVFLCVTFECATSDDETMIARKRRENRKLADQMRKLMTQFDVSNDGSMSRAEFRKIEGDPKVVTWLSAMDFDLHDAELVFELADDGDEEMTAEELAVAFSRLRGGARSMDLWTLICQTNKVLKKIETLLDLDRNLINNEQELVALLAEKSTTKALFHQPHLAGLAHQGSKKHMSGIQQNTSNAAGAARETHTRLW